MQGTGTKKRRRTEWVSPSFIYRTALHGPASGKNYFFAFFATFFLAGAFLATFFAAFFAGAFLATFFAAFLAGAFLATFFAAFFTAMVYFPPFRPDAQRRSGYLECS